MKPKTERPAGVGWVWDEENQWWFRVRKLTPKEALRLMGMRVMDIMKLLSKDSNGKPLISDTQLYKQAGNSIVVNVLKRVFRQLVSPEKVVEVEDDGQMRLL